MEESEEAALGAGAMARKNLQQRLLDAVKQARDGAARELSLRANPPFFCFSHTRSVRSTSERGKSWRQRPT